MTRVVGLGPRHLRDSGEAIEAMYSTESTRVTAIEAARQLELDAHGSISEEHDGYRRYALSLMGCPDWQSKEVLAELSKHRGPTLRDEPLPYLPQIENRRGDLIAFVTHHEKANVFEVWDASTVHVVATAPDKDAAQRKMEDLFLKQPES